MSRASQKRPIISLAQSCRYSSLSRESKSIGDEFATKTNGGQIPRRGLLFKAIPSGLMENTLSYSAAMLACLCFVSCGAVQTVKETTANAGQKVAQFSLADIGPAKVGVVEVREKDLQELPTGSERILALENKKKRSFWFFGGPVDFKEPTLPDVGSEVDGSLLPPRIE